jgi:hypothetical protein
VSALRCAMVTRDEGFDPLGSAGSYQGFLLVDWPLPWPSKVEEAPGMATVAEALVGTGIRLQAVVPGPDDSRRVVLYVRPSAGPGGGGGFTAFRRVVRRTGTEPEAVVAAAVELVRSAGALAAGPHSPPESPESPESADHTMGDLLVCTHGKRDACCGSLGTTLVKELLADTDIPKAGYQLARTSHTGGHRFAPTAIVLPEGTMWAFLDADLTARVVRRDGPVEAALHAYRGSTAMGSPALQALERVAFADVGWGWLDWRRWGDDLPGDRVRVTGTSPDGDRRVWEATATTRTVPVPDCGKPLDQARKTSQEPVLTSIARLPG